MVVVVVVVVVAVVVLESMIRVASAKGTLLFLVTQRLRYSRVCNALGALPFSCADILKIMCYYLISVSYVMMVLL